MGRNLIKTHDRSRVGHPQPRLQQPRLPQQSLRKLTLREIYLLQRRPENAQ